MKVDIYIFEWHEKQKKVVHETNWKRRLFTPLHNRCVAIVNNEQNVAIETLCQDGREVCDERNKKPEKKNNRAIK